MMIEIDGSIGEGGGSVVRVAVALSAASGKPIRIFNIRAKRPKPGLQYQHLNAVKAVANLSNASIEGLELGSTELVFHPGRISAGKFRIDIGTAGSTMLVLQALMPVAAFAPAPVEFEIRGGTDNPLAPPVDYVKNVTLRALEKFGYRAELQCVKRGYYPRGGGIVFARLNPVDHLASINLAKGGDISKIEGIAHISQLPDHVARRMAHSATRELISAGFSKVHIRSERSDSLSVGGGITLWAIFESGDAVGASRLAKRGVPAEQIGREAARDLISQFRTGAPVDKYLADQLIPYMALATGKSTIYCSEMTLHTVTNIALVERILGVKFRIDGELGKPAVIQVEGLGKSNPSLNGKRETG